MCLGANIETVVFFLFNKKMVILRQNCNEYNDNDNDNEDNDNEVLLVKAYIGTYKY